MGPPTPRQVSPSAPRQRRPHPGRGPYLELREQDLPPFGVGRHCTPLWTPHLDATAARGGRRRDGTGEGVGGVRSGERKGKTHTKKLRDSWRRSPCWRRGLVRPVHGERRGARALIAGSPSPPARRRRRPPAPTPSAQSLPPGDAWSRLSPRVAGRSGRGCKLLLSHHLAVTASQKRPHLAAARTRDGRGGRCFAPGGKGGAEGAPRGAERPRPEWGACLRTRTG